VDDVFIMEKASSTGRRVAQGSGIERSGEGDGAPVPGYLVADFVSGGKDMYFSDLGTWECRRRMA
jgi:hypothetical protein